MASKDIEKFQDIIAYKFKDESLLVHALTHSSYANEFHLGRSGSNERLEFLGDAVLELTSSEFFFKKYKNIPEGELTKLRASFVCERALYESAEKIPLSSYLLLGKGEESTGGRKRPALISDAFEAVLGAVYLDGGLEEARKIVEKFILDDTDNKIFFYDSKTVLQEEIQKTNSDEPKYRLIREDGPDHMKTFTVEVLINGEAMGRGTDSSKKHAEQKAAYEALKKLGKVK